MKYIVLSFLLMFCFQLFANPVSPEIFSELYMDSTSWWIELSPHWCDLEPGDSIRISSQDATIQFCVTDSLNTGDCLVVYSTQYPSLIPPFLHLSIEEKSTNWYSIVSYLPIPTTYPNNCIPGQSLVYQVCDPWGDSFVLCAEASPTPGTSPNQVTTFGSISGIVRDRNMLPVPNARVTCLGRGDTYSDASGQYNFTGLYGHAYTFEVHIFNTLYADQYINMIPSQPIDHDFILNDYYISNQDDTQTQTSPVLISSNPMHAGEEIKFSLGNEVANGLVLQIYNIKGESVAELYTGQSTGEISFKPSSKLASGIYLYQLRGGHKILKKGKITVIE